MDSIFLSPHLDDAVFSCGGLMARQAAEGRKVLLATVFTGEPDPARVPKRLRAFANYRERVAEDTTAASLLGVERLSLGFVEHIFQVPGKAGPRDAFSTPPDVRDFRNLRSLGTEIERLSDLYPQACLYAPLGIGNHHDHVETFLAALQLFLSNRSRKMRFYEDIYGISLQMRRQHFVARSQCWKPSESPDRVNWRVHLGFRLMAFVRRGPSPESYLGEQVSGLTWEIDRVPVQPFEAKKLEASLAYCSQIALFGGEKIWSRILTRYHQVWGGAEPLWEVQCA